MFCCRNNSFVVLIDTCKRSSINPTSLVIIWPRRAWVNVARLESILSRSREEDVKMMARCIQLCHECSTICSTASQFMSSDSDYVKKPATCVLIFVMDVLQNAKNINNIWNTVCFVLKHVENVQRNVVG